MLDIVLVQADLKWEDRSRNLQRMEELLAVKKGGADLILLPETFTTGFSMEAGRLAEKRDGPTLAWMQELARQEHAVVAGSLIYRDEDGSVRNRLWWVRPDGTMEFYDKRHLFRPGGEAENFLPGTARKVFSLKGFRFLPQVCYDLRFPVFSRNRGDYDVILYVANWPASRQQVWELLGRARAMENQCYVLGVNRTGTDGNGVASVGGSHVTDFKGRHMALLGKEEGLLEVTLDLEPLKAFRRKFPAWEDADDFSLRL